MDIFRAQWIRSGEALEAGGDRSFDRFDVRRRTSLERLAQRYKRFSILGMFSMIATTLLFRITDEGIAGSDAFPELPWWVLLCFVVYFAVASVMDYWLFTEIRSIDCGRMTVEQVLKKTLLCRKRHLQFIMVLIPMAIGIVGVMAYYLQGEMALLAGMTIGGVIGLACGSRAFIEFMRDYKDIFS